MQNVIFVTLTEMGMKAWGLLLFIAIVTIIYGLVNYYIFSRSVQVFPSGSPYRGWFIFIFWGIASSFVLARILERVYPCGLTGAITWIGSFWLAFMVYFLMIVIIVDLVRLSDHLFHWLPSFVFSDYQKTKSILLAVSVTIVALVVLVGFINARNPVIRELNLRINKKADGLQTLSIVMVSDIHLGTIISKRKATRLVTTINSLKPDIVLLAGDIVDEDLAPVIKNDLGKSLSAIHSQLGVFAITGNHEYIGGADPAIQYLEQHGITMVRDTALFVDNKFYLAGRDDRDKPRFTGKNRKTLEDIIQEVDPAYPIILMDHQPFALGKTAALGVDLSLSGHTHHGQLWPFNYITSAIYEISHGYKQIGKTHFYVSSGFGTWGPPVRLGNRPEIVYIKLTFNH